jgi:flagellar basal-body rod protein FlgG
MRALRTATTGMAAQQMNVEVISNNIANMNTVGFKKQRAEFQDLLYQNIERMGAQSSDSGTVVPTGIQIGSGVKTGSVYRIMTQGSATLTSNDYDLSIQGKGYFQILLPSGETAYTRAGNFSVDDQGRMVTTEGYLLQPNINIPQGTTDVTISKTGLVQVSTKGSGATAATTVGQIQIASFYNEAGLDAQGDNLFLESGASGAPNISTPGDIGYGTLLQGYTEASNVDSVSEITALIVAQRAYEMNSKVITTADQMLQTTSQLARG